MSTAGVGSLTVVGRINGTGSLTINDGGSLTTNQIQQSSLVIGAGSTLMLAPSNSNGNSLATVAQTAISSSSLSISSRLAACGPNGWPSKLRPPLRHRTASAPTQSQQRPWNPWRQTVNAQATSATTDFSAVVPPATVAAPIVQVAIVQVAIAAVPSPESQPRSRQPICRRIRRPAPFARLSL